MVGNFLSVFMEGNNLIKNHFVVFYRATTRLLWGMLGKELNKLSSIAFSFIGDFCTSYCNLTNDSFSRVFITNQEAGFRESRDMVFGHFLLVSKKSAVRYWCADFISRPMRQAELACRLIFRNHLVCS